MKTDIIPVSHPSAIKIAINVLQNGGIIAIPTDTVYGIAALATNRNGIDQLFEIKGRNATKSIAVLIGEMSQLSQITPGLNQNAFTLASTFWPGALTLIVPRNPGLPANLSHDFSIGIRMPNHSFALSLIKQSGPLATTSANISGGVNTVNALEVEKQLGGKIKLILDGGSTPGSIASTVVDCTSSNISILRHGVISDEKINSVITDF